MATLMMPVLLTLTAVTMDYTNAARLKAAVASALDAALLATARQISLGQLGEEDVNESANAFYQANIIGKGLNAANAGTVVATYDPETGVLDGEVTATANALFSGLINPNGVNVNVDAEVLVGLMNVELALVLDVTGSMRGSKLDALQDAANELIDTLMPGGAPATPAEVRISVVPYSDLVNVGDFELDITGYESDESCVYERNDGFQFTDTAPFGEVAGTGTDDDGFVNFPPGGNGNRWEKTIINDPSNFRGFRCSNPELMPLSANATDLSDHIDDLTAGGWTAGHIGIQWGWYTLSPNFGTIWGGASNPAPYDDEETLKAIVIMTDGAFNTWYEDGIGNSFSQGEALCSAMRQREIQVYTVGFLTRTAEENFLRNCASGQDNYFDASSRESLIDAFQQIGAMISAIRLTS